MIYSGNNKIGHIYKGTMEIGKILKGNTLIYEKTSSGGDSGGDYIEPTQQIFINTGIMLSSTDTVRIKLKRLVGSGGWNPVYGAGGGTNGNRTYRLVINCMDTWNENYMQYGNWGNATFYATPETPSINKVIYNEFNPSSGKWIIKIGDETFEYPITQKDFTTSGNCYLFADNDHGSTQYSTPFRLYEFEIVGKCHLIPKMNGNTPALWDTIRNQWFYNSYFTFGRD